MKKELEELTDEIRKLRREVRELREAGPAIRYVPQPVYVPWYPQPSYVPWWGTITVGAVNCGTISAADYEPTTTTMLPSTSQISLT